MTYLENVDLSAEPSLWFRYLRRLSAGGRIWMMKRRRSCSQNEILSSQNWSTCRKPRRTRSEYPCHTIAIGSNEQKCLRCKMRKFLGAGIGWL